MKRSTILIGLVLSLAILAIGVLGQGVPSPLTIRTQPVLTGMSLPVQVTSARDGTNRLFIVQQRGLIRVLQPGATATTDFISLVGTVSSSGNERGLLGLAFHPQFSTNRRFFVYYTRLSDGAIVIAEYQTFASNPNQGDPSTARVIITIPHPTFSNHNGGTIAFGPDGYLYAGPGDGGSGNDPNANAQNINALLGKILRIDVNIPVGSTQQYLIPPTNPYAGATPGADEIYAIGIRNPYRFSFDRGGTNQLWVGDVGQDAVEEVDIVTLGGNYGWRVYEGTQCTNNDPGLCIPGNYIMPIYQYANAGARCSVTGGVVYRGPQNTFPSGTYVYADYCSGEIFLNAANTTPLLDTPRNISSFGEDEAGEIFISGLGGTLDKVVRAKASADFDGDFRTDVSVFRPSTGVWYSYNSSNGTVRIQQFGLNGDVPATEDYDGDNISDVGVYRPTQNTWYYYRSSDATVAVIPFGSAGDIPAQGDFDGDAKADVAIFRPSTGTWWIRRTTNPGNLQAIQFGSNGDVPVAGDYDADSRYDVAVFRPSEGNWYRLNSTNGTFNAVHFGSTGDIPAPGDFDGDGKIDNVVYRPSTGVWYSLSSANGGFSAVQFGLNGDVPATGDYDGDGRDDVALFRPDTGVWYALRSSNGSFFAQQFGLSGDLAAPKYDAP